MEGGGAEGELTAQETALYDRQIRVWGVDAQKRCAAARDLPRLCPFLFVPQLLLLLFRFY
jgi:molybdopterin/thiamine biosynthesis adenylyltransferase